MEQEGGQPTGYKEIRKADKKFTIPQDAAPWMKEDTTVDLNLVTLDSGLQFYLARKITHPRLKSIAEGLKSDKKTQETVNQPFYKELATFINSGLYSPNIHMVENPNTNGKNNIYYYKRPHNPARVYFMVFDKMNGLNVIIRIAVCHKSRQKDVLKILTKQ